MAKSRQQRRQEARTGKIGNHNDGGIVVAFISSGMVHHEFVASLNGSCQHDVGFGGNRLIGPQGGFISMKSSPRIVRARTNVVVEFLDRFPNAKWLVTIDTDMQWDSHMIHSMIEKADEVSWSIVGGLCIAGGLSSMQYPTAYVVDGEHEDSGLPSVARLDTTKPEIRKAIDDGHAIEVDATGAAFMAIRRDVLREMWQANHQLPDGQVNPYPWYGEMIGPGVEYGEDVTFCLRARQLGHKIVLDTSCKIGHVKAAPLTWDTYKSITPEQEPEQPA